MLILLGVYLYNVYSVFLIFRFFVLIIVYIVGGILINKFGRHIESVPEVIPNLSFWKDLPFLFKVGAMRSKHTSLVERTVSL